MSELDEFRRAAAGSGWRVNRRDFLKIGAGAVATTILASAWRADAQAEQGAMNQALQTLNEPQIETLDAIAECIWPADDEHPGAAELGAAYYVDRALTGPYSAYRDVYRQVLAQVDEMAHTRYGAAFHELGSRQQSVVLGQLEGLSDEQDLVAQLEGPDYEMGPRTTFELLRTHVMEGVFCDPIYGGNREFGGWRAVNYPGAQYIYTAEEQQSFEPLDKPMFSVADL